MTNPFDHVHETAFAAKMRRMNVTTRHQLRRDVQITATSSGVRIDLVEVAAEDSSNTVDEPQLLGVRLHEGADAQREFRFVGALGNLRGVVSAPMAREDGVYVLRFNVAGEA